MKARADETSINLDPVICEVYRVARTSYRPVSRARIERSFRSPAHRVDIGSRTRVLTCEVSVHRLRETRTLHRMNPDRDFHFFPWIEHRHERLRLIFVHRLCLRVDADSSSRFPVFPWHSSRASSRLKRRDADAECRTLVGCVKHACIRINEHQATCCQSLRV